jgi:HTH-type transcriptional repressor of NAD biosynthesis genes
MTKAFVFGKFLPFHTGHEAMINFALTKCDYLTVLICCSDKENIPANTRKYWIEKTFQLHQNMEVKIYNYFESELPNTSKSSQEVSKIWAEVFTNIFPDYTRLITSEEYGYFVATFMHIEHLAFDIPKRKFPVSATAVRNNLFANWKFLPAIVKPYFAIKVVIVGTESTGKTTLAEKLASHFQGSIVSETARDIIQNSNAFTLDSLYVVAQEHAKKIEKAVCGNSPLIIIDTDIHITKSYASFVFREELNVHIDIYNANKANLYLYMNNSAMYIQDGTRLNETDRNLLDLSHRKKLKDYGINTIELNGTWDNRFQQACLHITNYLNKILSQKT